MKDKFKEELLKSLGEIALRQEQEEKKPQTEDVRRKHDDLAASEVALIVFAHRLGYTVKYENGRYSVRKYRSKTEKAEQDSYLSYY